MYQSHLVQNYLDEEKKTLYQSHFFGIIETDDLNAKAMKMGLAVGYNNNDVLDNWKELFHSLTISAISQERQKRTYIRIYGRQNWQNAVKGFSMMM